MYKHTELAAERFDAWADSYGDDRISNWFKFFQAYALKTLNISTDQSFLDVGCGTGWAVIEAAKKLKYGKSCGIDISPLMIRKANTLSQEVDLKNIEFSVAGSDSIPYPEESFDSIICTFSFHHYPKPLKALSEIRRVMKMGGNLTLIDSARNVSFPIWLQDRWRRYFEKSHVKYYTTHEMIDLIKQSDLRILQDVITIKKFMFRRKFFTGLMIISCKK